ncbi:MAG TPA: helix-turn-helix domain-containing protein [Terriglobales bacterium]
MKSQLEALVGQMHDGGILYSEAVREFKKTFILNVLERNGGNQCKAARELGMHRNTLSRTIAELSLDVSQVRAMRRPMVTARTIEMPSLAQREAAQQTVQQPVYHEQAMEKKAAR